ncbi:MAG: HD domain-containing protein [Chloroflexi bacterium]|nr:HD domain-containing protein [Chloroflexota bacterium]
MTMIPVPSNRPLFWSELIYELQHLLADNENKHPYEIYIVGGTVRDMLLRRPVHDLDFVTPEDGRPIARLIANAFNGDYYPLDAERKVGRALIQYQEQAWVIDVAQLRAPTLEEDLRDRDFSINAMAVNLHDLDHLFDPTDGLGAIDNKQVMICAEDAIYRDPVRALRAIRMSLTLKYYLAPETKAAIRRDGPEISRVSPERVRDELFKLLGKTKPSSAIALLDHLGLLALLLPETPTMQGVTQSPPHTLDVWRHTLSVMDVLDNLLIAFGPRRTDESAANFGLGMVIFSLAHLRSEIVEHVQQMWPTERSHHALMMLAALAHDIAKPITRTVDPDGRIRFFGHPEKGAEIAEQWGLQLRLSNDEIERLYLIVYHHMRPLLLYSGGELSRRAIYRFWRDLGAAGVDVCLMSCADYLATYGTTLNQDEWLKFVQNIRTLLEGYYRQREELVSFPMLLDGRLIMSEFDLEPGPIIGQILDGLREAQAVKEVQTKHEAMVWVEHWLAERGKSNP